MELRLPHKCAARRRGGAGAGRPRSGVPGPGLPHADLVGGLLATSGLVLLVYALIEAPDRGRVDSVVLGALSAAGVALAAGASCAPPNR